MLAPIELVLFELLKWLEALVGDWGVAIILLTIIVRVLLIPLTWKQTKSMYEMQRIQPQLKELQEKYKNDKEKQQEEVLKFYQEHKVNPFGGCLPLILQLPIFFALFAVLGGRPEKPGALMKFLAEAGQTANFLFVIPDIAKTPQAVFTAAGGMGAFFAAVWVALPYLVLVILFALSVWLPQQLMPGEKQQKMIGSYMALIMLYFGWISPAGVLLYWVTSSIWGIGQQQLTLKVMQSQQPALATAGGSSEPKKVPKPKMEEAAESSKPAKKKKRKKK
ncbi:MAG: YidC/Oxa1 family membrane protein insertase [Coriobacteriales bacterium]|nr:YidC/Oxa1 family membrane protein insertase [Coriobacteriales bacterium]